MWKDCTYSILGIGKYMMLILLLGVVNSFAQLSGTYTINPDGSGERNYTTFAAAVTALNSGISSAVIFNVESGKTFNESPLTITATGTISNTITFQKSGGGAKPIINISGTSGAADPGIQISGGDYFIFDGIEIRDAGTSSSNYCELGFYFEGQLADGCQNNIVKNCVVDLTKSNNSAWGVYVYSIATANSGKNNNNKFYNNTIKDCFVGYYFRGNSSSYSDDGNEVGTIDGGTSLIDNIGADGGNFVFGVRLVYQQNAKVFNTTISNLAGNNLISGISQAEGNSSSGSYYNNILRDFSLTLSTYSTTGISISSGAVNNIYGNEIYGLSSANGTVAGISLSASGATNNVYKNKIYNLEFSGTSIDQVSGITTSSGTNYISNNYIYDLRAPATQPYASYSVYVNVIGLELRAGNNYVFNNSVLLNYTSTQALNESACLYSSSSGTVDLRNNILVNKSDMTTGTRAVVLYRNTTSATNISANTNNNIYYAGTPGSKNLIYYDRTNSDQTLAEYKTRMDTKDQNSKTENVPYVSSSDLHINPAVATQVESGGIRITSPFAVTDDYDGNTRALETGYAGSGSAPDIGADEGEFTILDLSGPNYSYTPFINTSKTTERTLTVTITDGTGVPTSGIGLPMLYWKINSGSWTGVQGVSIGSGQYTFTFGAGVVLADVVSYYLVAQDAASTKNVSCSPSSGASGFTADPPAVSTPPTSPPSYTIIQSVSGTILVGDGQTYTSLTRTGGLFEAINNKVVSGNITVNITSDLIETGEVELNETVEEGLYSIEIKPADASLKTITGFYPGGLIRFNGADNVTIDGRFNGGGRYLTIYNYYSNIGGFRTAALMFKSKGTGAGAINNTVRNCVLKNSTFGSFSLAQYTYGISIGGASLGDPGYDNDNYSIIDNLFTTCYYGIFAVANATGNNDNLTITGNTFGSETAGEYIGNTGIAIIQADNVTITNNHIFNILTFNNTLSGITISSGVTNGLISGNKIHGIKYLGSSTYGGRGIVLSSNAASCNITVANNLIYDILGDGSSTNFSSHNPNTGISISSGGGYNLYFNSVNLTGSANRNAATVSASLYVAPGVTSLNLKNNIFLNGITNVSNTGDKAYSIYSAVPNTSFTNINYNDYYVLTGGDYAGVLGYLGGDITTIADWRTATGQDANSLNADPNFKANDNLIPLSGSPVLSAGTPVAGVTTDFFGDARSGTNPSIGASENAYVTPVLDWANLQHPASFSFKEGLVGQSVYAQVYEPLVTNAIGQGAGIQCWIGWSTSNSNPDTWTNWVEASFQGDAGNNDEYTATIGTGFTEGIYYYASRWSIQDGAGYQYGGYSSGGGGFWNGTGYVSGVLTVQNNSIDWANLQSPQSTVRYVGENEAFYARVYVPDVTTLSTVSPSITCWIGINSGNTNPSTWSEEAWIQADFNTDEGNNDEYFLATGQDLPAGTYYYASRFRLASDAYVYGGYNAGGGGFWDGVNNASGMLTIEAYKLTPPFAQKFESNVPPFGWGRYEGVLASPSILQESSDGWYQNDWRNTNTSFGYAANVNIYSDYDFYWLTTPAIGLGSGAINYELRFDVSLNRWGTSNSPQTTGIDDKFAVVISTDNGTTWSAANTIRLWDNAGSPYVYNNIPFNGTNTKVSIPLTGYTGDVMIGFYGESTIDNADNDLFVDNVQVREIPDQTNTQTITQAMGNSPVNFTGTGMIIQLLEGTANELNLTVDKISGNPGGNLPGGLLNLASQYWEVTLNSGTLDDQYCISVDVSGCGTVSNYATLHLLKRDNAASAWVDIGVPTDVSGAPVLKWCYPALNSFSEFGVAGFSENPLPVELASFTSSVSGRDVILNWSTKTEISSNRFVIERSLSSHSSSLSGHSLWETVGEVKASGNSNSPKEYSCTDKKLNSGNYSYRLKMIDNDGSFEYSKEIEVDILRPSTFDLRQNYPNPFNPSTVISYQLPVNSLVRLELFSITGEKVATLVNDELEAGYYNYQLSINNYQLSSGVYFYRLAAGNFVSTKKMIVLK
ncbi:MAG: T9SS type A sorting domain-containing protein [Ignavibacteriaceae bacterium]